MCVLGGGGFGGFDGDVCERESGGPQLLIVFRSSLHTPHHAVANNMKRLPPPPGAARAAEGPRRGGGGRGRGCVLAMASVFVYSSWPSVCTHAARLGTIRRPTTSTYIDPSPLPSLLSIYQQTGEELLGESAEKDASGNKKLPAIGEFLKAKIGDYFKAQVTVPSVRPTPLCVYLLVFMFVCPVALWLGERGL